MQPKMCSKCRKNIAVVFITKVENGVTMNEGYCLKCARSLGIPQIDQAVKQMGISDEDLDLLSDEMSSVFGQRDTSEDHDDDEIDSQTATFPLLNQLFGNSGNLPVQPPKPGKKEEQQEDGPAKKKSKKHKFLDTYCMDLTGRARAGKLDQVIGRDVETERVIQILNRRQKNNPCLIGEPGVGKTAIAEGLAQRIAAGKVPYKLRDKEVFLLDLTALVAGTQFRGQFESRMKSLIGEIKECGNIILVIDEVHNLVGAGDAEGSMNAANILKPALSRGEIQVIGATTFAEYRKYIEKDAALERRFQPVTVAEPTIAEASQIMQGIAKAYAQYHGVEISPEIAHQCVVLSERYITDRFLPDKAIDLLDEACTCANLRNKAISEYQKKSQELQELKETEEDLMNDTEEMDLEEISRVRAEIVACENETNQLKPAADDNGVTEDDLANVIQLWTGIPASKVIESDLRRLAGLEKTLKSKVIGQDEAVALVSAAIRRSRVQISPRRRPASFIFVGPTGVGKTELVKQLANELFDTPETLIRLDMSEFMEKHSVSRIIGSPPGYVGYDEAGQLTEKVRRKPYSVILFDEIEKAHPDVLNILLQILDEGRITDAQGRTVNFENTVIIMTSNAGSERKEGALGFAKDVQTATREKVMKALSDFLRPEFIGRVDEVVVFRALTEADYEKIAVLMLNELVEPLREKGIRFTWEEGVPAILAQKAFGGQRGARDLRNLIRRRVEDQIASLMVERCDDPVSSICVSANDDLSLTSV